MRRDTNWAWQSVEKEILPGWPTSLAGCRMNNSIVGINSHVFKRNQRIGSPWRITKPWNKGLASASWNRRFTASRVAEEHLAWWENFNQRSPRSVPATHDPADPVGSCKSQLHWNPLRTGKRAWQACEPPRNRKTRKTPGESSVTMLTKCLFLATKVQWLVSLWKSIVSGCFREVSEQETLIHEPK